MKRKMARSKRGRMKNRKFVLIGSVGAVLFLAFGTLAGPWSPFGTRRIGSLFYSSPPPPVPTSPAKEYIYAGGRLLATEEPNPLVAPANVAANTVSAARITLTWNSSGTAHHYVIERATQLGNFTTLNNNVSSTTYNDDTVSDLNAYLYRVRSADAAGNLSPASNIDLATAITFEDDPFPDPPTLTLIRAKHILQLREAVNAVRHVTPTLGDAVWAQPSATLVGAPIKGTDLEELRNALDPALQILGLPPGGYTDSTLAGKPIVTLYIKELRTRVK